MITIPQYSVTQDTQRELRVPSLSLSLSLRLVRWSIDTRVILNASAAELSLSLHVCGEGGAYGRCQRRAIHVLDSLAVQYGVALASPFSLRRFCSSVNSHCGFATRNVLCFHTSARYVHAVVHPRTCVCVYAHLKGLLQRMTNVRYAIRLCCSVFPPPHCMFLLAHVLAIGR